MTGTILFVLFITLLVSNFGVCCGNIGHAFHDLRKNRNAIITSATAAITSLIICVAAVMFYISARDLDLRIKELDNFVFIQQTLQRTISACEAWSKGRPL